MKEAEIRPKALFNRYLELSRRDAESFEFDLFVEVACPGCGGNNKKPKIKKYGFQYVLCGDCGSLYCSPRPNNEVLSDFYKKSVSAQYWSNVFFPAVAEIRREQLFRKKARNIHELLKKKNVSPRSICDVGAGYGVFLQALKVHYPKADLFAVEPSHNSAEQCREKGIETLEATAEQAEEWHKKFDLVISSEVIEHVFSAEKFVNSILVMSGQIY